MPVKYSYHSYMKLSNSFLLHSLFLLHALLIFQFGQAQIQSKNHVLNYDVDRASLISFKNHVLADPFGALVTWSQNENSTSVCHWHGVTCGNRRHPKRVTTLSLRNLNLTGTITSSISNLTFLRILDLSNNLFDGSIPDDISHLIDLEYLSLANNSINGKIPPSLGNCSNLHLINMRGNQLTGSIPYTFGALLMLQFLGLGINQLGGSIPPSLGNLTNLSEVDLGDNSFEGEIPQEFGKLRNLVWFAVAVNNLHGPLPYSIFNISSLQIFDVGSNYFSGMLPSNIGYTLPNLQSFDLFYNQFEGPIPSSLSNISELQDLTLHGNNFQGLIPTNIGIHGNLRALELGHNLLEAKNPHDWDFVDSLVNCSHLQILNLELNHLQGLLPKTVANLSTELTYLNWAGNQISGSIPSEIGKFYQLTYLYVSSNILTGTIPETIGRLQNLHMLGLAGNKFEGKIPSSLGNLSQLNTLDLSVNYLEGNIPTTIGNLSNLGILDLSYNKLNGSIPQELGKISSLSQYLNLSNNFLDGPIPMEVGNLKNLGIFDVSYNKLSGDIPATIGECLVMEQLYLQRNLLQGKIPSALSNLKGIQELDLSNNNLSGPFPEYLSNFQLIWYLNLSFNNLVGHVPSDGIFRNRGAVYLVGNDNLCDGPSWLHLWPCDQNANTSRANRNRLSFKLTISLCISIPVIITLSIFAYCYFQRPRMQNSDNESHELYILEGHECISYFELRRMTNGFASENLIGKGGFGSVYKGTLPDSKQVAIKVLNLQQFGASRTFLAECEALKRVQHRNLVKLITVCSSIDHNGDEFKALVFEFVPNGSLHERLHSEDKTRRLNIKERLDIAIEVAYALEYLHYRVEPSIAHCDLKPSNIFLNADLVVHVGDFGLARLLGNATSMTEEIQSSSTIGLRGTIGYLAPEYGMGVKGSTEGDVYSFGVMLLEIITGKRPTDEMFQGALSLPAYVEMAQPDQVLEIVDPNLVNEDEHGLFCAISLSRVGLLCTKELPKDRMNMQEVLHELLVINDFYNRMNEYAIDKTIKGSDI